jgi:hypothetical protein
MDARLLRLPVLVPALLLLAASSSLAAGHSYSTANFVVSAPSDEFAKQVGETAERCRSQLARAWLGYELPRWYRPCTVTITAVGQVGAGGATTFTFANGQVFNWNMHVQGSAERILDSVIPHEVSHTIFASHFRRPLPRWADEGAASLVEHESEQHRQLMLLRQVFNTPQRIPLVQLISMKEYPTDMQAVLTLYAEGYSLADYLVQSGGRERYLRFLQDAYDRDWNYAIHMYYGLPDVVSLERHWRDWVMAGSPELPLPKGQMLAQTEGRSSRGTVIRSQSPDAASEPAETAPAQSASRPLPQGTALMAPAPVDRRALSFHNTERQPTLSAAASENQPADDLDTARETTLRQEGRDRMLKAGWQPALRTASNEPAEVAATAQSNQDDKTLNESSARRRFRSAKERHSVEAETHGDSAEPSEETRTDITERDLREAQTPFHTEN